MPHFLNFISADFICDFMDTLVSLVRFRDEGNIHKGLIRDTRAKLEDLRLREAELAAQQEIIALDRQYTIVEDMRLRSMLDEQQHSVVAPALYHVIDVEVDIEIARLQREQRVANAHRDAILAECTILIEELNARCERWRRAMKRKTSALKEILEMLATLSLREHYALNKGLSVVSADAIDPEVQLQVAAALEYYRRLQEGLEDEEDSERP
ncbi:hypothetical protein PENSPDRAFT_646724 [Peniophora sp. CONT]|nr:hypothetical protein PENSPDRAFT_646724 [Peniophora sp. CONT]